MVALFLDVQSAYPTVHPDRMVHILKTLGCPAYLCIVVRDFLKGRSTVLQLDDYTSAPKQINIGLPRGSPLLVILYILYNSDLLRQYNSVNQNTLSIGYVDDVVHLTAGKTLETALTTLTNMANHSMAWGGEARLHF